MHQWAGRYTLRYHKRCHSVDDMADGRLRSRDRTALGSNAWDCLYVEADDDAKITLAALWSPP